MGELARVRRLVSDFLPTADGSHSHPDNPRAVTSSQCRSRLQGFRARRVTHSR
jgi:hypothetical protein